MRGKAVLGSPEARCATHAWARASRASRNAEPRRARPSSLPSIGQRLGALGLLGLGAAADAAAGAAADAAAATAGEMELSAAPSELSLLAVACRARPGETASPARNARILATTLRHHAEEERADVGRLRLG